MEVSTGNILFSLQVNLFPRLIGLAFYRYVVAFDKIARGKVSRGPNDDEGAIGRNLSRFIIMWELNDELGELFA